MKNQSYDEIRIPDELSLAVKKGIRKGKKMEKQLRRKTIRKKICITAGSAAAALAVFFTYCFVNPAFAAELPLIGGIFAGTEQKGDFPGDYSRKAERLADQLTDGDIQQEDQAEGEEAVQADRASSDPDSDPGSESGNAADMQDGEIAVQNALAEAYGDTDQKVTMIPEEVFCDGSSLYVALRLKTEEEAGFGQDILAQGVDWYTLDYSMMQITGSVSDGSREFAFDDWLIGEQEAHDTFCGRLKIAVEGIDESAEELSMHVSALYWVDENKKAELQGQEDVSLGDYYVMKQGDWNLTVPVKIDKSQTNTFSVNQVNEYGFGIESITVTPYEIRIKEIVPQLDSDLLNQIYTGFQELCAQQLGEEKAEELLTESLFESQDLNWHGGFAVFNQDGERMEWGASMEGEEIHEGEMKNMEKLYFYLMPDGVTAYKCRDQSIAEKCNIYSYVLELK